MKIYRPMLFVGLGGTGCRVGAELERRMREDLCGPDGTRMLKQLPGAGYLPYQLPRCLQFVYADLSADELARVRREVVPGREHDAAAQRTMRLMTNLIPADLRNSAAVSQRLSVQLREDVVGWLPPKETDPNVGPLLKGAGQLPTVGRAVLFETMRRSPDTAVQALGEALTDINQSADDLQLVSEGNAVSVDQIDVFVAFSVAGGTGSGIFYDYLHLIGDVLSHKNVQLYPLVLMPSSFDGGPGGGRAAELNAGASLIDLFHLIDDQNAQGAQTRFDSTGGHGITSVLYPAPKGQVHLKASTVQSGFLFGRPIGGLNRDSINRSMVAMMLSIIGAGPSDAEVASAQAQALGGNGAMSFADSFINGAASRNSPAETGIGRRGVSTSAVAELTVPLQELTDVLASRFLANAVTELLVPKLRLERNSDVMLKFLQAAGLDKLVQARPVNLPPEGEAPAKYDAVVKALHDRGRAMARNMDGYSRQLEAPVASMAHEFSPANGAEAALRNGVHLFRLQRVLFGHRDLSEHRERIGAAGVIEEFRFPPPPPQGFTAAAPPPPQGLPKKRLLQPLRWPDPAVQAVKQQQDSWYRWRARQDWNAAWGDNFRTWDRTWAGFRTEFEAIMAPFLDHARGEPGSFDVRAHELYAKRVGVSYLLPPVERGLLGFYQTLLKRLKEDFADELGENAREGEILVRLVDQAAWAAAYRAGRDDPAATFAQIRQLVKEAVAERLRPSNRAEPALIPSMVDLLARAAGKAGPEVKVSDEDLRQFEQKLAVLVPGQYAPEGTAPLEVLFTYPAQDKDDDIERYLRHKVALPPDFVGDPQYRAIRADSMVVVLMRTNMGVTEVPEVRKVMKLWSDAQRDEGPTDNLAWRRRLAPQVGYLLMTEKDRENVLFRLLCAAWNGKLRVTGPVASPDAVEVLLGGRSDSGQLVLDLQPVGALSSWASVLQAYERFVLVDDNPVRRIMAEALMGMLPDRFDTANITPPATEFVQLEKLAEGELRKIREAADDDLLRDDPQLRVFREFWEDTLPRALARRMGTGNRTLKTLPQFVDRAQRLGSS